MQARTHTSDLLYCLRQGQGQALFILHGLLGSSDNWQWFARKLATQYSVYTPDLRNHGRSFHATQHDYDVMADDIAQLFKAHRIEDAYVIGHSMGAKVAMHFALIYPHYVKKLVELDMSCRSYTVNHKPLFDALLSMPIKSFSTRHDADTYLAKAVKDSSERQFLLKNLTRQKDHSFVWSANLPVLAQNLPKLAQAITGKASHCSSICVYGELSSYVKNTDQVLLRKIFPSMHMYRLLHAGHWLHADNPLELLSLLEEFLRA